eukprot:m.35427 g.35427  ORF g.35427 m.35427 type:complete len:88 (+) comp9889_c0_seq2:1911-2174(+)
MFTNKQTVVQSLPPLSMCIAKQKRRSPNSNALKRTQTHPSTQAHATMNQIRIADFRVHLILRVGTLQQHFYRFAPPAFHPVLCVHPG